MTVYQVQNTDWGQPASAILPMYLYQQYYGDTDLQAFVDAYNTYAQSYLSWYNTTSLGVYTSAAISGTLLDWVGQGIYGIARPVLSTSSTKRNAGLNSISINSIAVNAQKVVKSGISNIATDDVYKRVLTWHTYRGDGQYFNLLWLKKRVARFIYGTGGTDYPVLDVLPSVTVSGATFTITVPAALSISVQFQQCVADGILELPFQYTFNVVTA